MSEKSKQEYHTYDLSRKDKKLPRASAKDVDFPNPKSKIFFGHLRL